MIGRLRLALCGTRDAAVLWQECLAEHLLDREFVRCVSNYCLYGHEPRSIQTLVYGDDDASTAAASDLRWLRGRREVKFDMKTTLVAHSSGADIVKEGNILSIICV